ncbi:MAG: multi-sensor signal transduction histidine kinase [Candidatus Peribacteria bacterium]|nr:multi-sensor signal transduction histidine kinase [Candidatus Peribacteria bacterium]
MLYIMDALPASIEAYMVEAGFTPTELLIVRRLMEDDALTLRQIAAKTGKSTGVLDQAMKKLLRKKIVSKEGINDSVKYILASLNAIVKWMEEDTHHKRSSMLRRHQDFEAFISSLKVDKMRPDMQYFEGVAGIEQAYTKLLGKGDEWLQYVPLTCCPEEDPMKDFRVQHFRDRKKANTFCRIIAHNTSLGRRFQARDMFEYRKTVLIPEEQYPFTFEKIIVGNTIACINHEEKRACFIEYPELASMERLLFENMWAEQLRKDEERARQVAEAAFTNGNAAPVPEVIPLKTRTISALREFFLGRNSIIAFGLFALVAGGLTFSFYRYSERVAIQRMGTEATSIASAAATLLDPNDINALQVENDWKKPEWAKVVHQLEGIRLNNPDILFVYIIRKNKNDPTKMEFVSDSHSLNPYANTDADPTNDVDVNNDGVIHADDLEPNQNGSADSIDLLQWPGQPYSYPPPETREAYNGPIAMNNVFEDEWGKVISGYAPIKNREGEVVGILATDMKATTLQTLTVKLHILLLVFTLLFVAFVSIRFEVHNKSLLKELIVLFKVKTYVFSLFIFLISALIFTYGIYVYTLHISKKATMDNLQSIAATAALDIDYKDVEQISFARDMKKEAYQRLFKKLNNVRLQNPNIKYAYILRKTSSANMLEFVVDADTNYYPLDGREEYIEPVSPGTYYDVNHKADFFTDALKFATATNEFFTDQWGTYLSGGAPIRNADSKVINSMIGFDMDITKIYTDINSKFSFWLWFIGSFSAITFIWLGLLISGLLPIFNTDNGSRRISSQVH